MAQQNNDKKVKNFRLSLLDDETHKPILVLKFTKTSFLVSVISACVVLFFSIYAIIAFTPVRNFIPGYPDAHTKRAAIQNAMKVDSLEIIVSRWSLYSENLKRIFEGEAPVRMDSLLNRSAHLDAGTALPESELRRKDSILRSNVREEEQFELSRIRERDLHIEGMHFFCPLKGVISLGYDKIMHPYIDITAPANSVVNAVLDGTVIFAGWNDEAGYTLQIQHENDIISVYKHNQKLLKKTGDRVSAGSPVAIVGNTGSLSTGDHLHFELWYRGEAVDPTKYINF